jgi:hypothetical protein
MSIGCGYLAVRARTAKGISSSTRLAVAGVEYLMNIAEALLGVSFFVTLAVTVKAIANIWMTRIEARGAAMPAGALEQRLERIEAAVDVVALEVERIAEAQRFAARLAAEHAPGGLPAPGRSSESRAVTPH